MRTAGEEPGIHRWGLAHAMLEAVLSAEEVGNPRNAIKHARIFADPLIRPVRGRRHGALGDAATFPLLASP